MGDKNEKTNLKFKILEGNNKVKEKEREKATNLNKIVIFEKVNSWFAQRERERERERSYHWRVFFYILVCSLFTNYNSLLLSM